MNQNSILSMKDLSKEEIINILNEARAFQNTYQDWQLPDSKALVANLFFEPSTRTHFSFISAEHQLGMDIANFDEQTSSIQKGESLYDTVKLFEVTGYDCLVIRNPQNEYYKELESISIPIINAGDGSGQHPSQSLLDLYTIYEEFGRIEGLNILIVGDIEHSRVASSNKEAMEKLGAHVRFAGPKEWSREGFDMSDFDESIPWADVIMMLRIQKERGAALSENQEAIYLDLYGLNKERYARMKENAIILHPAPFNRGVEIDSDLVESEKSRIFKQMENGVYIRKAMLKHALGHPYFHQSQVVEV